MSPDMKNAHSAASREENDDEPIPVRTRFIKEEPALRIPTAPVVPPIVIHRKDPISLDAKDTVKGIIGALARLIGDKYIAHQQSLQGQIDHRLKQQINEKKLAMGLKIENTQKASYQTEEEYEQSM